MVGKIASKYGRVMVTEFKKINEYKFDLLGKTLKPFIRVVILILLWSAVFRASGSETIGGLDKTFFYTYIIISMFLTSTRSWWDMYEDTQRFIIRGALTGVLSRPLSFYSVIMSRQVPYAVAEMLLLLPVFGGVIAGSALIGFQFFVPGIVHAFLFIVATLLSVVAALTFYYGVCLAMFWFGDIWSLYGIFDGIESIFSGAMMPVTIQSTFNTVSYFLPFRHFVFTPVFIYLEKFSVIESVGQIGLQIVWIVILWFIAGMIYRKGLQKFDSQGG